LGRTLCWRVRGRGVAEFFVVRGSVERAKGDAVGGDDVPFVPRKSGRSGREKLVSEVRPVRGWC
jgi:hypothetical protein